MRNLAKSSLCVALFSGVFFGCTPPDDPPIDPPVGQDFYVDLNVTGDGAVSAQAFYEEAARECRGSCSFDYSQPTVLTLTAIPDAGFVFQNWSNECTTNPCLINVSQSATVAATFALDTPESGVPVTEGQSFEIVPEYGENSIDITLIASDPNGDDLTVHFMDYPLQGRLSGDGLSYTYTFNDEVGCAGSPQVDDSFSFLVEDIHGNQSNVSTVTVRQYGKIAIGGVNFESGDLIEGSNTTSNSGDVYEYAFCAERGQAYMVRASQHSGNWRPALEMVFPDGSSIQQGSAARSQTIMESVAQTGLHTVFLSAYTDRPGNFSISLAVSGDQSANDDPDYEHLSLGQTTGNKSATPNSDTDVYTFDGVSGQAISLTVDQASGTYRPEVSLIAPDGSIAVNRYGTGGALITTNQTLTMDGEYTVIASERGGDNSGYYQITLSAQP